MAVIPFYGTSDPELFAIERAAADRSGHVLRALDRLLPNAGRVLDVGAGDGFTAEKLTTADRVVVPMEPAMSMMQQTRHLSWVCGEAEALPFHSGAFSGLYATWAYFFPSAHSIELGVREAERVVTSGGPIAIVNNLGDDEFCSLAPRNISESVQSFDRLGFTVEVVETQFEFDTVEEAQALLGFYFGDAGRAGAKLSVGYRVGVFHKDANAA